MVLVLDVLSSFLSNFCDRPLRLPEEVLHRLDLKLGNTLQLRRSPVSSMKAMPSCTNFTFLSLFLTILLYSLSMK